MVYERPINESLSNQDARGMSLEVLVIIAAILRDAELKVVFVNKTDTFLSQKKKQRNVLFSRRRLAR